jgi:leader peptidase (prepilin peptidase)/N-methyltransferase
MNVDSVVRAFPTVPGLAPALAYGIVTLLTTTWLVRRGLSACDAPSNGLACLWGLLAGVGSGLLTWLSLAQGWQQTPEVRPDALAWLLRPAFHSLLIALVAVASATDLRTYYILDSTTLGGAALAILLATVSGDFQICHVWVDWNAAVPQLRGPDIPAWLAEYPHLHGLAWSLAGLVVGGGLVWIARAASAFLLGQQALGFGDVTLMAMIGAFLGWQPVVIVFLLAPLCAILGAIASRAVSTKPYIPYGPFLSLAAVIVLFGWREIWMFEFSLASEAGSGAGDFAFAIRRLFGDWQGLLILAGMLAGGLVLLLGGWRLFHAIPVDTDRSRHSPDRPTP